MSKKWLTEEIDQFLCETYPHHCRDKTTKLINNKFKINLTRWQIIRWAEEKKIHVKPSTRSRTLKILTQEQEEIFSVLYKTHSATQIATIINKQFRTRFSSQQLKRYAVTQKIRCDRTTNSGQFKRGENKYPPPKGTRNSPETEFKKGNIPPNRVPLYTTRVTKDGMTEIKVPEQNPYTGAPTRFKTLSRWTWEQCHGPIPPGHSIIHRDHNSQNNNISNLVLLSRSEAIILNNPNAVPPFTCAETNPVRINLAKLKAAIAKAKKTRYRQHQETHHEQYQHRPITVHTQ